MGNIQMVGKSNAEAMRGEKPKLTKLAPEWTLADVAEHAVDFWLTTEDLPVPGEPGHHRRATATSTWPTPRPTTTRPTGSTAS